MTYCPGMRKTSRVAAVGLLSLALGACAAGPHQLRRSVDDFDHRTYVNSPWLNVALWTVPVIPTCLIGATALDFAVTDPYFFWFGDAWDGNGTGFQHLDVEWPDGRVDSLLLDRSGLMRYER